MFTLLHFHLFYNNFYPKEEKMILNGFTFKARALKLKCNDTGKFSSRHNLQVFILVKSCQDKQFIAIISSK